MLFLVFGLKVSFNRYLMLAKHFRWTVYNIMLKYDIMTHLDEFLMLFLVFDIFHTNNCLGLG